MWTSSPRCRAARQMARCYSVASAAHCSRYDFDTAATVARGGQEGSEPPGVGPHWNARRRAWELGCDYGLADHDGRRLDWGRHKIDFSVLPPTRIDVFRTGTNVEVWLTTLAARTRVFRAKIPS